MVVERITTMRSLRAVRERWNEIYDADERANVFLSWPWIEACCQTSRLPWVALAVRERADAPYVAFLPLACDRFPSSGLALAQDVCFAGVPRADYAGLIALPSVSEDELLATLAAEIDAIGWDNLRLTDALDARVQSLAQHFPSDRFEAHSHGQTLCPFIDLPPTFEQYLQTGVSEKMRAKLLKKTRQLQALAGYRFECAGEGEIGDAIETLLHLNRTRWKKNLNKGRRIFGDLFRRCADQGIFTVFRIFDGTVPVAAQGLFIDRKRDAYCAYMVGYNPGYATYSPGIVLHGLTIRYAIEHGLAEYDLLRGNEPFKARFARTVRTTRHVTLTRRGLHARVANIGRSGVFAAKAIARRVLGRTA